MPALRASDGPPRGLSSALCPRAAPASRVPSLPSAPAWRWPSASPPAAAAARPRRTRQAPRRSRSRPTARRRRRHRPRPARAPRRRARPAPTRRRPRRAPATREAPPVQPRPEPPLPGDRAQAAPESPARTQPRRPPPRLAARSRQAAAAAPGPSGPSLARHRPAPSPPHRLARPRLSPPRRRGDLRGRQRTPRAAVVAQASRPRGRVGDRQIEPRPSGFRPVRRLEAAPASPASLILASVSATVVAEEPDQPDDDAAEVENAQTDKEDPSLSAHARDGIPRRPAAPAEF